MRFTVCVLFVLAAAHPLLAQKPSISIFSPVSGPAGTIVTITGTNFSATPANNIVYFGAVRAAVSAASATQLTVTVPSAATFKPISVEVGGLTGFSSKPFLMTFISKGIIDVNSFAAVVPFTSGSSPYYVRIADFDGDGYPDLASSNYNTSNICVFRHTGSTPLTAATFGSKVDFSTVVSPYGMDVGDLDGDGKLDIAQMNSASQMGIFRNTSTPGVINSSSFASRVVISTTNFTPYVMEIGELDGDGKPDIAFVNLFVSSGATISAFRNTSSTGSISFASQQDFVTLPGARAVTLGDIDQDGKLDILYTVNNTLSILRNTSSAGAISFAAQVDFATGTGAQHAAVGDIDGDGVPDVAVTFSTGVSVFRNTSSVGSISLSTKVDFTAGTYPNAVALGDLDGDGKLDMAVANNGSANISVLKNTGSSGSITAGSFANHVDYAISAGSTTSYHVAIGDLDSDGKPDIVASNVNESSVATFKNVNVFQAPVANAGTAMTQTGFTANWSASTGATGYRLDVSTDNFSTFVSTYNNFVVAGTSQAVTGLTAGITYQYRVRATNSTGASPNSSTITVPTIPPTPTAVAATLPSQSGFTANWNTVAGATGYTLDVSTDNFSTFVPGYNGKSVAGTSDGVTGLGATTLYYYRVRSTNASGASPVSNTITITTLYAQPTTQASDISLTFPTTTTFNVNYTDGNGSSRIVVAKAGSPVSSNPADGTVYTANSVFGSGSQIGSGNYVVGIGSGPFSVTGLTQGTTYYFSVFEYNGSGSLINYNVSAASGNPASGTTLSPVATLTQINSGTAPVIGSSILTAGTVNQVLAGFSVSSTGSQSFTAVNFNMTNLSGVSNIRLFKSGIAGSVGSSISTDALGNFTGLTETITGAVYYYLVVDIGPTAYSGSPTLAATASNVIISGTKSGSLNFNSSFTIKSSQTSDIILNGGTTASITYSAFQATSGLTSANSASLATFRIRDGGGSTDTDALPTQLQSLTLQFANASNLQRVALFDGTTSIAEQAAAASVVFSVSVSAPDNSFKDITVRATFKSTVTDNQFTQVTVTAAAAASASSSGFATSNAGGAATSATTNQIIVTADRLAFAASPPNTSPNTNFALTIRAVDALSNTDIDRTGQVTLSKTSGPGTLTANSPEVLNPSLATGSFSWTKLSINLVGTYTLQAAYSGLTSANVGVTIIPATEPTTQVTGISFSTVTPTAMTLSFTNGNGSSRLLVARAGSAVNSDPVDGTTYTANNTFGSGTAIGSGNFVVGSGSGPITVTGLSAATVYHFRAYEFSGGPGVENYLTATASGNPASQTTLSPEPGAQPTGVVFSSITTSTFNATITPPGAPPSGYLVIGKIGTAPTGVPVDGTAYSVGATLGDGAVVSNGLSTFSQSSLSSNSTYSYAVFSFNGTGGNINYLTASPAPSSVLTLPDAPIAVPATNTTTTFFDANWQVVSGPGAVTYQVDESKDNFATVDQTITGITTNTQRISGLTASTDYKFRVRAVNATNPSANSNAIIVHTLDDSGTSPLSITTPGVSFETVGFGTKTLTVNVSGGISPVVVTIVHRPIESLDFEDLATIPKGGGSYEATIAETMLDELGMEYFIHATDGGGGDVSSTSNSFIYKQLAESGAPIPFASGFNGKKNTYQMFSVPYDLDDKSILTVFDELGGYDRTKWRLFRYQGNKYVEATDGLNTIEAGKGYWFNTIESATVKIGAAKIVQAHRGKDFTITLQQGWNQIGNPFPFPISWAAVNTANGGTLNPLVTYGSSGYSPTEGFKAWAGGFLFSDGPATLNIPVTVKCIGCRTMGSSAASTNIDEPDWQLPIAVSMGHLIQESGIGMNSAARDSKDALDQITVPRFVEYLELDTYHPEFFAPRFSRDIVSSASHGRWELSLASSEKNDGTLTWDQGAIATSAASLYLIDTQEGVVIDMKTTGRYAFPFGEGNRFKIVYSRDGAMDPGITFIGSAYPNPFSQSVTFPVVLASDRSRVDIAIYDMMGRKVASLSQGDVKAGVTMFTWNGSDAQGFPVDAGVYVYQLLGEKGSKRLIKQMR